MRVTTKDIARELGISDSTVSRVLNGASGDRISPSTRQRVLETARQMNYRPNLSAQGMKSRKTRQVGISVMVYPQVWDFVVGANKALEEGGYIMTLVRSEELEEGKPLANALAGHLLEGLIIATGIESPYEEKLEEIAPNCVWLDTNVWRPYGCIRRDELHAGQTTAQSLLDLGYQEFIYIDRTVHSNHYSFSLRLKGVREKLNHVGATLHTWNDSQLLSASETRNFLTGLHPKIAVITADHGTAQRVTNAAMLLRIVPGLDFALASCDAGPAQAEALTDIACVSFDRNSMGMVASQMLMQMIETSPQEVPSRLQQDRWQPGFTAPPCPTHR